MKLLLIAPDMEPIKAYRKAHPESRRWAHMTPRSVDGTRGYSCDGVKILAPVTITEEMFSHMGYCLMVADHRESPPKQ